MLLKYSISKVKSLRWLLGRCYVMLIILCPRLRVDDGYFLVVKYSMYKINNYWWLSRLRSMLLIILCPGIRVDNSLQDFVLCC